MDMDKNKRLLIIIIVFAIIIAGAWILYDSLSDEIKSDQLDGQPSNQSTDDMGEESTDGDEPVAAPDFTVYDIDGNEIHLLDYKGKPVILNFWASWCGPCKSEMPDFDEAYARLGDEIHFLMINMTDGSRETIKTASDFISDAGYGFPVYYDTDMDAAAAYGAYSLPMTFFIDAEGRAIAQATGAIDAETLQTGISMIM